MKSSLYTCIQDIQNGDREQALALLEKFSPLLKKYAFFLQSEDALQDFLCFSLQFTFRNTSLRLSCFRLHVPLSANGCLWLAQCGRHNR